MTQKEAAKRARAWASANVKRIDKLKPRQAAELAYERALLAQSRKP